MLQINFSVINIDIRGIHSVKYFRVQYKRFIVQFRFQFVPKILQHVHSIDSLSINCTWFHSIIWKKVNAIPNSMNISNNSSCFQSSSLMKGIIKENSLDFISKTNRSPYILTFNCVINASVPKSLYTVIP